MSDLSIEPGSFYESDAADEWINDRLIEGFVKGESIPYDCFKGKEEWLSDVYQIVCSTSYDREAGDQKLTLGELIFFGVHDKSNFYEFKHNNINVLVIKGHAAIERLNSFIEHYLKIPPQKGSPMYNLYFTCGSIVDSFNNINLSYKEACCQMERRFFAAKDKHVSYVRKVYDNKRAFKTDVKEIEEYGKKLIDSVQTVNRSYMNKCLGDMYNQLCRSSLQAHEVKRFLLEEFYYVLDGIRKRFSELEMETGDFHEAIYVISEAEYLYQIFEYFTEKLDKYMTDINSPERNGHINDILYYIDHNLSEPLHLEKIAPLFGYNSAYLGKIFKENVGESFNTYLDRVRIERAKELLVQGDLKVYEVSERVGYRNVDYFHKKFLKLENKSPAVYKREAAGAGSIKK